MAAWMSGAIIGVEGWGAVGYGLLIGEESSGVLFYE